MSDKIKPPCGYGDIMPLYVRGRWIFTSDCEDYRAHSNGEAQGFTWFDLIKLGVADTEYQCPDFLNPKVITPSPEEERARMIALQKRWEAYQTELTS